MDAAGRLEYVSEPLRGITTPWVAGLAYDDNGNRSALTYYLDGTLNGDTVAMGYGYNNDNRLTGFSTTGGPTFALSGTTVDGLGRLRAGTETLTLVGGGTRQHVLSYGYDMRSQLKTASVSNVNSTTWTGSYTYDKAGNVASQTVGGANTNFGYDGDLMTDKGGNALDWDADGRMISGLSRSLTYNWDSKLRSATSGSMTVDLRYDPDGNRVLRSVTNGTTSSRKYIVDTQADLPTILLEIDPAITDPNQSIVKTYIYANSQIVAQHDGHYGDAMYFYLHDRLGSVREVIDTNAAVQNTYTYEPFGQSFTSEVPQTVVNPWQFTGQWYDSEFGQYFLRARQYDPAIYRFTSRDPYRGSFQEPLELHRYLYCTNDPINFYDPTGNMADMVLRKMDTQRVITVAAIAGLTILAVQGYYIAQDITVDAFQDGSSRFLEIGSAVQDLFDASLAIFATSRANQAKKHIEGAKYQISEHLDKISNGGPNNPWQNKWLKDIMKHINNIKKYANRLHSKDKEEIIKYLDDILKQVEKIQGGNNPPPAM